MFLHIGSEKMVDLRDVVAILDIKTLEKDQKRFNQKKQKKSDLVILDESSKSLIYTEKKVYCSPISSLTLLKRSSKKFFINRDY